MSELSQSLFYWIIYSYNQKKLSLVQIKQCLNPYFIGLSILIIHRSVHTDLLVEVSILILLDYLFLWPEDLVEKIEQLMSQSLFYWIIYSYKGLEREKVNPYTEGLNPYFIGLSILILG